MVIWFNHLMARLKSTDYRKECQKAREETGVAISDDT